MFLKKKNQGNLSPFERYVANWAVEMVSRWALFLGLLAGSNRTENTLFFFFFLPNIIHGVCSIKKKEKLENKI